jgi:hypothetical protein
MFTSSGGVHGNLAPRNKQGTNPFYLNSLQGTHVGLVDVS